ncbi:hypothetical protein CRENBAI_001851 [Crenichthys baileyi]|uniref:PH domain-containing protein n=1 Tax=Crenichthys baileyi TaxID=28760 RepID=A0AAV9RP90_9TELE
MEKTLCSPGTNRTNSSSSSPRKPASRSGSHSPGSGSLGGSAGTGGGRGTMQGSGVNLQQLHARRRQLEGVLSKYTNLIQGWQNRYFVLDPELGQLQYFINEQGKTQKPRGSLPLIGASVTTSDEAPHMFIVHSVNGELYKLKASDAKEQQFWINQLQACARRHSDSSAKILPSRGFSWSYLRLPFSELCLKESGNPETQRLQTHGSCSLPPSPASQGEPSDPTQRSIHLPVHPPTLASSRSGVFSPRKRGQLLTGDQRNYSAHCLPTTDAVEKDLFPHRLIQPLTQ